jgi:uncharacterized protein
MDTFARTDHRAVLACLTDEIEWVQPGAFRLHGKAAFEKEMQNEAFVGSPAINVSRMIEENKVVVAEGGVRCAKKGGGFLSVRFCDIFEMQDGKVRRLTSYLVEIKE